MRGRDVPVAVLEHWYECGRKRRLLTLHAAHVHSGGREHAQPYECTQPGERHWHVGRPRKASPEQMNHAQRQTRLRNMQKAWDRQAYRGLEEERQWRR